MKILLTNPPWDRPGWFFVRAGSRWPHFERAGSRYMPFPFFMGYSAAVLEKNGFKPQVLDACAEKIDSIEFLRRVFQFEPELLLMETSTPSFDNDAKLAQQIKKRLPRCKVVFAGAWEHPAGKSLLELAPAVDFFLVGEYEFTLLELVSALRDQKPFSSILSLEWRDSDSIIRNPRRLLFEKLDELPFPARHLFKMDLYEDLVDELPQPSLQLWGSRGCPFSCTFCVWPQIVYKSHAYRVRSPENIVKEIEYEISQRPYKSFYFDDDTFNIGKPRILGICAELKRKRINLPWGMMARADTSDEETLSVMRDAGLTVAKFGVESGVQELVDRANKSLDLSVAFSRIRFAKSIGIRVHLTFTFGLPGETRQTVRETVERVMELDPDSVQFSILTPFPGSNLFEDLYSSGKITDTDLKNLDGYSKAVISTGYLSSEELEEACRYAEKKWRKHQIKKLFREPVLLIRKVLQKPYRSLDILSRLFFKT